MWTSGDKKSFAVRGFSTPPASWRSGPVSTPMEPMSERKRVSPADDPFHVLHKVPAGDSPYVRAKQVQLIDKDPSKAIALFWSAINSGDRVDSALKDMAVVMKQLDRSEEAIEAIKSFRHLCSYDSQESLNNVLVELYKRAGRIQEEIEILQSKLKHMEEGVAFGGRRTKTARSQGKKVQITVEQERSRILGNLAWAYLQQKNYKAAEEHYMKSLSLETDRNKQCNLAICLMHMGRISEARSLLQVVRNSFGNKPMDESYAKSFERAFQMLTELESRAILRPIFHDENCCSEVSRSSMSPIKRNPTQAKRSLTYESSPNFSRRMKENQGIPEVLFTQPRRSSSGFHDGHQTWGCSAGRANRKLSFGQSPRPDKPHVAQNLRENMLLDTGKPEITFQNSVSSMSSPTSRDWRRPQGDAAVQSVLLPISSGDWKDTSRGNNGCFQLGHEGTLINSSQQTVIGDSRAIGENGGLKKSGEPQMGGANAKALATSIDGGQKKSSEVMAKGSMQSMNTCVESSFGGKTPDVADTGKGENQKPAPHFSMYSNGKKSWADMVEEEEQELLIGRTEYCHGSNTEDEFHNENLNCNIMPESPCLQTQMNSLSQKVDLVGLKDEYVRSGSSASPRNSTVRRSLLFDQQQEAEAVDYFSSSPAAAEALNFEGSDSICGNNSGSGRRKRLQSFQDITEFQDSP